MYMTRILSNGKEYRVQFRFMSPIKIFQFLIPWENWRCGLTYNSLEKAKEQEILCLKIEEWKVINNV